MIGNKTVLAIIPARAGSKGIVGKNMIDLMGKPLIKYSIDAACGSKYIDKIVVNTDDTKILEFAKENQVGICQRPEKLAQDDTPMKSVIDYQLELLKKEEGFIPDIFILLQPTSPLRTSKHIDEALECMMKADGDAVVSVIEEPHLYSPYSVMQMNELGYLDFFISEGKKYTSRQQKPKMYARNGAAIYAVCTEVYQTTNSLYGNKCAAYIMQEEDSVDIDKELDLYLAECLIKYRNKMNDINKL